MTHEQSQVPDANLEQTRRMRQKELEACQQNRHLTSCMACEELIGCSIREAYVEAVYASMNKGQGGGFAF